MKTGMIQRCVALSVFVMCLAPSIPPVHADATENTNEAGWKLYTNARFGFSIRYPDDWRLGNPMPDGVGVMLHPPIEQSLVAVSGHMNVVSGSSPEGRQTLEEFASAHHRIITDLYSKKQVILRWQPDQERSFAGLPGKELIFTYTDNKQGEITEHHIFSLGRNEGRGVRVKVPHSAEARVMPTVRKMLDGYQPGRDQNAVSPLKPNTDLPIPAPR
ncbi:MAG TPA: hypothetical protein PKD12_01455 [Nitrospira sp.]|nr:hypothetical protein [Nitrospira sp.]